MSQPTVIERGPYLVVGAYCPFDGDDEGPGWDGAGQGFFSRAHEVEGRPDDLVLGFLYRPHRDDPTVPESVRACFVGVEVSDAGSVPEGLHITRFSGGKYAVVGCEGDSQAEAADGVGAAIAYLSDQWLQANGYREGDACFAASHESAPRPPYIEYVHMKLENIT